MSAALQTVTLRIGPLARAARALTLWKWISAYVCIEDPETGGVTPFRLWPGQRQALRTFETRRRVIALKARQLGLTWLVLAYAAHRLIYRPGYRVNAISKGGDEAKELVRRLTVILENMPSWIIQPGRPDREHGIPGWIATTEQVIILHPSGRESYFKSFAASPQAGRTFTASLMIIDEWAFQQFARQIWAAAYPTINAPESGQVIGISTGKIGTLFQEIWTQAVTGTNDFEPIFLPWTTDPRRTPEWYEKTKRELPHEYRQEYPETPEDAFSVGTDAAFLEWNRQIHVPLAADWYPPPGWRIFRAYDAGWTQAACKWYAVNRDGHAVAYREFYPRRMTDEAQARMIRMLSKTPDGASEEISYTVADPSAWNKDPRSGESTALIFQREGVPLIKANNDRINGWKRLHTWLAPFEMNGKPTARLLHTEACVNSIRCYPAAPRDKHKPDDVDTDCEDHLLDVDRYFVMSRPQPPKDEDQLRREWLHRDARTKPLSSITGY